MFPAEAKMYLAPIKYSQYAQDKIEFFSKPINGIDLSSLVYVTDITFIHIFFIHLFLQLN
jgi:hypothetical protein